jgi:SAM-dependent methyltransferase
MPASDWLEFWDAEHLIYVNARHETAHCRRTALGIREYAPPGGTMLDDGCGEALSADIVAEPVDRLFLCESAANKRLRLAVRFAGNNKIAVRRPEDVASMADHSFDVIVLHSVAQYLSARDFEAKLKLFHRLLKPGGLLVVGDVIPRRLSALADVFALLRFGREEGFFFAAVRGLVLTYFSDYRQLRKGLGLTRYDTDEMIGKLEAAGFSAELARSNIGHIAKRMTFLAHAR